MRSTQGVRRPKIELADQLVDNFDQFVTRQAAGNLVDTQDVGKQDGDILVLLRNGLLPKAVPLDNWLGHR